MQRMRALVIGGDSRLGSVLCTRLLGCGHEVVRTTRRPINAVNSAPLRLDESTVYMDMLSPEFPELPLANGSNHTVVYIMAAVTGVVPAERHPHAWRINAEAPLLIAREAHARNWHVVFPSSGTVELAPHTASAMQKAYADHAVLMLGGCVVRLLPFVKPEWYDEVAGVLITLGTTRYAGVVRWGDGK